MQYRKCITDARFELIRRQLLQANGHVLDRFCIDKRRPTQVVLLDRFCWT